MSYPRNAASPPSIAVGEIYQLSDGANQTSGVSVRVKIGTGSFAAGGGTLTCDTTSGTWYYTPTQAETNADTFIVTIYKASCTTASVTVPTSASATAGYVGTDHGKIANPTSTVNLSGTTIAKSPATLDWDADVSNKPTIGTSTFDHTNDQVSLSSSAIQAIYDFATASIAASGSFGKYVLDSIATLLTRLSSSRASYLDNLNVGGAVASQADIDALNQSASRRVLLVTVGQYERPESGSVTYTVEARTFDADGAAVAADSSPTLTGAGSVTGSLAANIGIISNPSTGVYRWQYTVASAHNQEQVRFDLSATIDSSTFTLATYTQVVDLVAATWTSADATKLAAIFDKLPSADYLLGSDNPDGSGYSTHSDSDVVAAFNADATQITLQTNAANAASSAATAATQATTAATQATAANAVVSHVTYGNSAIQSLLATNNATTAKLATMIESDGSGGWRYTAGSLSQAGEVTPGDTTLIAYVSAVGVVGQAASSSGTLTIVRYSDFSVLLTGLGSLTSRDDVVFTVKASETDTDDQALVQASETGGLLRLNGEAASDSTQATITVTDESTGSVRIELSNEVTAALAAAETRPYSVKLIRSNGEAVELTNVDWQSSLTYARIITGITRAVE